MKKDRSEDLLRPAPEIAGIALRPLSSGSYALLNRVGNAFVCPTPPDEKPDHIWAALEWIYIHAAPIDTALRAAHGSPDGFKQAVLAFSESVPVQSVPKLIGEIERCLTEVHQQSVDVVPRHDTPLDKDAPPNS
jgi:hypothetical protein